MNRIALYTITFVANAAVLVFEIAGVRLLAPYMGTSTEVWAGLIAVILGGLAGGYWLGGKVAGKEPTFQKLSVFLFLAAAAAFLAWILRNTIPPLTLSLLAGLPLTAYAVLAGTILFAPTTILLGAVSPYAVRLALRDLESAGGVIGTFSAIGAVGSILGAILTGSYLIPSFGLSSIMLGVVASLGALTLLAASPTFFHMGIGLVLIVGTVSIAAAAEPKLAGDIVADVDTPYNRILVSEVRQGNTGLFARYLKTDPFGIQCSMIFDPNGPREDILIFPYLKGFSVADSLVDPKRTLMLGGCNYSYPRFFLHTHPHASMDVVELDPGMTAIAEQWFGLVEHPRLSIEHQDARLAFTQPRGPYDAIYMDAFNSFSSTPFQLTTVEFFSSLEGTLTENGVLVANTIGSLAGEHSLFTSALYRTLREVFPAVAIYRIGSAEEEKPQNLVFVASRNEKVMFVQSPYAEGELLSLVPDSSREVLRTNGLLLTDDYSPVEALTKSVREMVAATLTKGE